ncbi:hypothetical protein L484_011589 [Morus notabilis]|uniref:Uncharacterized protein n=1 Tax=Morus notabilis TaxID=981085 RepID=W9RIL0_9ROSA|nr:hypothetical protein L484_011589 [Morus notabilis]
MATELSMLRDFLEVKEDPISPEIKFEDKEMAAVVDEKVTAGSEASIAGGTQTYEITKVAFFSITPNSRLELKK